eukprot:395705-Hanusia_phi.AAC.2
MGDLAAMMAARRKKLEEVDEDGFYFRSPPASNANQPIAKPAAKIQQSQVEKDESDPLPLLSVSL